MQVGCERLFGPKQQAPGAQADRQLFVGSSYNLDLSEIVIVLFAAGETCIPSGPSEHPRR